MNASGGRPFACGIYLGVLDGSRPGWNFGLGHGSWRGPIFPMEVPAKHHLEFYASQFDAVELCLLGTKGSGSCQEKYQDVALVSARRIPLILQSFKFA